LILSCSIQPRLLIILLSRPEDSEYELANMAPGVGTLEVFPSIWGHWAGGPPGNMEDVQWLDGKMRKFLNEN